MNEKVKKKISTWIPRIPRGGSSYFVDDKEVSHDTLDLWGDVSLAYTTVPEVSIDCRNISEYSRAC